MLLAPPTIRLRPASLTVFTLAAALTFPLPANADERPPNPHDNVASVWQYVEDIPTAEGPQAGGSGGGSTGGGDTGSGGGPPAVSPSVAAELRREAGSQAKALERAATSPAYGAPTRALPMGPAVERELAEDTTVRDALTTTAGGGSTALIVLVALLLAITAASVLGATRRVRA